MLHSLPAADTALSKLDYPSIVVNYFIISIVMNNFGFLYKFNKMTEWYIRTITLKNKIIHCN